jgi:LPPG:FO 2-phospho-L-lactate transferase
VALERIVVLVGGVGGAKLAHGLAQILEPGQLSIIVNTGDDFWHYGLRVCPDLDTVMYTLSGLVDKTNGWGVGGDTVHMMDGLRRYGEETWFRLGDRDLATHLLRSMWLREGQTLTKVTQNLAQRLGIQHRLLPMSDQFVATIVETEEYGALEFQSYFVRHRWQPTVTGLRFESIENARMSPEVEEAIQNADVILIGPSNPWLSIAPILSVPGLLDLMKSRDVPRVAVSPIVQGAAIKGPAAKLMAELDYTPSAESVAHYYADAINGFVYDQRDMGQTVPTARAIMFGTIMETEADRARLARDVLNWIKGWNIDESLGHHTG